MISMNVKRKKQSQFELFPGTAGSNQDSGKKDRLIKDLTLSLENISVLCIIFVMVLVLFFSFGVERGKRIVAYANTPESEKSVQSGITSSDIKNEQVTQMRSADKSVIPKDVVNENVVISTQPLKKNEENDGVFTIQVASFRLKKNAEKEAEHLKGIGLEDAFVVSKGSYTIVCVGKFLERSDAKLYSNKLKNRYDDCLVRRL